MRTVIFLFLAVIFNPVCAADFFEVNIVAMTGAVNKEQHQKFWQKINSYPPEKENSILDSLRVKYLMKEEFKMELYKSYKLSYDTRKLVKTERYLDLELQLEERLSSTSSVHMPEAKKKEVDEQLRKAAHYRERLLKAASLRQNSFSGKQGEMVSLDILNTQAKLLIKRMEKQNAALIKLFDPIWEQ